MKPRLTLKPAVLGLAAALATAACASGPQMQAASGAGADVAAVAPSAAPTTAAAYVAAAGASDRFEIQSSRIALQKARAPEVRAFAQMMIDHHTMTTADLTAAARQAGLAPPPPTLPPAKATMLTALQSADGDRFDGLYMRGQVTGHQEALTLHDTYAQSGDNPALKAVAAKAVPIVRSHLDRAQTLAGSV
jgi:putative membrane protein